MPRVSRRLGSRQMSEKLFDGGARMLGVSQNVATLLMEDASDANADLISPSIPPLDKTYSRPLCRRNARGASGLSIVSHAFGTLTPKISLRLTLRSVDFSPNVAASLNYREPSTGQGYTRHTSKLQFRTFAMSGLWIRVSAWCSKRLYETCLHASRTC